MNRSKLIAVYAVTLPVLYGISWLVSFTVVVGWSQQGQLDLFWRYVDAAWIRRDGGETVTTVLVGSFLLFFLGLVPALFAVRRLLTTTSDVR